MLMYFKVARITDEEEQINNVLYLGGDEAMARWTALGGKEKFDSDPEAVKLDDLWKMFEESFEKTSSHWQYRDQYLSDVRQQPGQSTAELDLFIKELIDKCKFPPEEVESRKIDLLYHATAHFELRKYVQTAKPRELTYEKMIETAKTHERTCQDFKSYKASHGQQPNSYNNPLINVNAVKRFAPRRNSNQQGASYSGGDQCQRCGLSHAANSCPAYRSTCNVCGKLGHWGKKCHSCKASRERPGGAKGTHQ